MLSWYTNVTEFLFKRLEVIPDNFVNIFRWKSIFFPVMNVSCGAWSVTRKRLRTADYGLRTTDYGLRTTDYELRTTRYAVLVMQCFRVVYLTIIPWARVGYEVVNSQRGAKRRVGYNHSYPTRANGIIVLLNSSLVKMHWTFHFDVNEVIVWGGGKICGAVFTFWVEWNTRGKRAREFSSEDFPRKISS